MVDRLLPRGPDAPVPGVVLLPGWMDADLRLDLVTRCRAWSEASGGPRSPRMRHGTPMSVAMVGLGWHWFPYRYSRTRDDADGGRALPFPPWLGDLALRAVADAVAVDPTVAADPEGFAQQLSNELGVQVTAPTEPVWSVKSEEPVVTAADPDTGEPIDPPTGSWVNFQPQGR